MPVKTKHERIPQSKIAIIGAGSVGATIAYTLVVKTLAAEVVLIDVNQKKLEGEIMDLDDGQCFSETGYIHGGSFRDAATADIIIHCAGAGQKSGETRMDLVKKNKEITRSIFKQIGKIKSTTIVIVVTNPVDILTHVVQEIVKLPKTQVFGTGTALDTARLRGELARHFGVYAGNIDGYILGEHGDSEFAAWSTVSVAGIPLHDLKVPQAKLDEIEQTVKMSAYEIIERKGATYYGIAMATVDIVEAILFDQHKIIPVSQYLSGWNCMENVCISASTVIGRNGIEKVWPLQLNAGEIKKLKKSAEAIRQYL
ncbi:MAG: L-lactate dehydrogenase [bacterium]|nr:L-lactate dehydrogenase [bacterium]